MATITAPVKGFSGNVVGVDFKDGTGETDNTAQIQYFTRHGYTVEQAEDLGGNELFDPAQHNVDEVLAHIAGIDDSDAEAHDAEVVRVLEAERAGKDRKSIIEAGEGAPAK